MYNLQLETFIVVADMGSFNKAAEALYITPPAVTKQMNLLEKDLGLTLFVRTHRGNHYIKTQNISLNTVRNLWSGQSGLCRRRIT